MPEIFKHARESDVTITELMIPSYANFGGKIHGGILLSMMDKVAYACASKHSRKYCVTVAIDNVEFMQPVEVGELVSMKARINYVGRSSMEIGIRVESENTTRGIVKHTNTSYFIMVAKDENDNLVEVPGLILESREDIRRFIKAIFRKQINKQHKEMIEEKKETISDAEIIDFLKNERCELKRID